MPQVSDYDAGHWELENEILRELGAPTREVDEP